MLANRNLLIVAIAAFVGIIAVIIANSYLSGAEKQQATAAEQGRLVQIAVARVPLAYGDTLSAENIRMVSWPSTSMPAGAFQSPKGLYGGEPRVVLRPIEVGEPILPGKITGFGGRASLSELLQPDMRAVAVRINDVAGVAGFVLPGDRVDVLLTRTPKLDGEMGEVEPVTDILLQNVGVMAIDQSPNDKENKPNVGKTATLTVDQQGAQKLALAGQVGTLSLALRNAANQDEFMSQTVGTRDLGQGNTNVSLYAGAGERRSATPAFSVNPFPYPMQAATSAPRGAVVAARPRPANSVGVEIVRGTTSTNYDVTRQGGY
ncbi:Flp pilus assembly protein CpaB [Sphingorhabdus sp.]|uniref:Flp pilus assembly protein CpaB n=1 Tax=Sphingorhabdus sp. TaxID=1902408 RepID=UPI00391D812B